MNEPLRLNEMIVAIAPRLEVGEIAVSEDNTTWTFAFADGRILFLDIDASRNVLVCSTELQAVSAERQAPLHKLFLEAGALWRATDGSRIALEPQGGTPTLILEVGLGGIDERFLERTIDVFLDKAAAWNLLIRTDPGTQQGTLIDPSSLMIRI